MRRLLYLLLGCLALSLSTRASEPTVADAMSFELTPAKTKVYAGEPLRLELTWHSTLDAGAFKDLRLSPDFFKDPNIRIVIPHSTAPENEQVGLPIGGRRAIATRTPIPRNQRALGTIRLTLYLRFAEPGKYTLPATTLDSALLDVPERMFGRYAAYFDSSFFESVNRSQDHTRIRTTAPPINIEVLPLPVDETMQPFSGLFEPVSIELTANPTELEIGQLIQLEFKVNSHAPHGMIDLPPLRQHTGLRRHFIIDDQYSRLWQPDGTIFRARMRPLATSTQAIPALNFRTFDPESGQFNTSRTDPIPLTLHPSQGQDTIPLSAFEGVTIALTDNPEGIWHNLERNPMNDILNQITQLLGHFFWPLLGLGPILFLAGLPAVRERRRRALNPAYARRVAAYKAFKQTPPDSPEKWPAFLNFMGTTFQSTGEAWTRGDTMEALKKIKLENESIEALVAMHHAADAATYSQQNTQPKLKNLDPIAQKIARLTSRAVLLCCLLVWTLTPKAEASQWDEAEQSFAQAQAAPIGSDAALAAYKIAALQFQDLAASGQHRGEAWRNAGNAWFEAGQLGRAIIAYRHAQGYRPFDPKLEANLGKARALALNVVPDERSAFQKIPTRWIRVSLILLNLLFWLSLLAFLRYRSPGSRLSCSALGLLLLLAFGLFTHRQITEQPGGCVIVESIHAKKGPDYAYANAFNEALHDGLEFTLLETRNGWLRIQLADQRDGWIPKETVALLER